MRKKSGVLWKVVFHSPYSTLVAKEVWPVNTTQNNGVSLYNVSHKNISGSWLCLAGSRGLSLISLKSLCSIILLVLMPGNSFGEDEWNLTWLEFTDCKHCLRKGYSHVLHLKKTVTWFCPLQARMLRTMREGARKNIPPLYFFWMQFVLKHPETKTTSVVLVAVCEQRSPQCSSPKRERYILSLTASRKVKSKVQLRLLDYRQSSFFFFFKTFGFKKIPF